MTLEINTIAMPFVFNVSVNCYLVRTSHGFILIDAGRTNKRGTIEKELVSVGCLPGNLKLIVLTHGDFDHCGNAGYLRQKFGIEIAMHKDDSGMVERGDMLWNRNKQNILIRIIFRLFFRLSKSDRFKPDLYIDEGYDFSGYGFDAKVLNIPGHSKGSIGILTASGDLFCGDLLANVAKPEVWSIIDDKVAAHNSIEKLKRLQINTVYPGHGQPFPMELFIKTH
ncbi:MAG: MBL fold metallo-hydrolase [Candidatus Bathyarchaeota archaeon]|nr:MBL fold metallo-hydrolase [Candidatus Bathyarchaeota archaeon]MDH5787430.1 MBL fold metallo-hydrolase [Candidatus Bathyarchaeota archaeon]